MIKGLNSASVSLLGMFGLTTGIVGLFTMFNALTRQIGEEFGAIGMQNERFKRAALETNVEAAKITSTLNIDGSAVSVDLGSSRVGTFCQNDVNMAGLNCLVKAAEGSRSVYVAGIAVDAQDYGAADDLDLVFHFEYLD